MQRWVQELEIAGPGFINLRLKPAAKQAVVAEVLRDGDAFGRQPAARRARAGRVRLCQPDRPAARGPCAPGRAGRLHLQPVRGAGLAGDARVLLQRRRRADRHAGASTQARLQGLKPGDDGWPEAAYNGDYIADIAAAFRARARRCTADDREFTASGDVDDLDDIRQFAVAYLRHEQDLDLQAFGVRFDHYFLESSLYTSGRVEAAVQRLVAGGNTYEKDGALWLRTTDYGDDKDRVMRKSDGSYTYFVPDVAYHVDKFERGFDKVINVQGSDHHGTIARVRAGLQAARPGHPARLPRLRAAQDGHGDAAAARR